MRPSHDTSRYRAAHTLMELVAATVASGFLLAGLAAVMLIGQQVAYTPTAAIRRTEAANVVNRISDELRYATMIVQHVDTQLQQTLEFVVADRDNPADGAAERIRYDWPLHPDPGQRDADDPPQLYKTSNGHTWVIANDISEQAISSIADVPYRLSLEPLSQPFSHAVLRLQAGLAQHSRVDAAIPLLARPEKLAALWRADFDANPTAIDVDGSGEINDTLEPDWIATGGATFVSNAGPGQLANGTWQANGDLATNPANDFAAVTVVEARCKNLQMDTNLSATVLQINADRDSGTLAPLIVRLQRRLDGSQTLSLLGNSTVVPLTAQAGALVSTSTVDSLPDDYVRFRLTITPAANTVNLQINGIDVGTFPYVPHAAASMERCVRIGGGAKFDYVDVRVRAN